MPELKLTEIVQLIENDRLVIPDFQRGFKWQTPDIRKLLESLLLDFPIGAALFWRTQRGTLEFRRVEDIQFSEGDDDESEQTEVHNEAPKADEIDFILDGQQRITSIYKLFPKTVAPTEREIESRFKGLRFFLALDELGIPRKMDALYNPQFDSFLDPDVVASAIVEKRHTDLRREYRSIAGAKAPQRLSEDNILKICERKFWLPLTRALLENKQTHLLRLRRIAETELITQIDGYRGDESRNDLKNLVINSLDQWTDWFTSNFQAALNSKSLTCLIQGNDKPEGLARIFETINSTGLSLSVFDLLVARLGTWNSASKPTNLRKLLLSSLDRFMLQRFDDDRSLGGTASQQFPRLLALRTGKELKKGEILKVKKQDFLEVVDSAAQGLQVSMSTLVEEMGVINESSLPFKDLISLIGSTHARNSSTWEKDKPRVVAFLWATCLIEDWDSSTNDKTRLAYRDLTELLAGRISGESIVNKLEQQFPAFEDLRDATSKASLLYRTFMAFNLSRGGIDWAKVERFRKEETLEDHHIFPKDWLSNNRETTEDKQLWIALRDSVLNRIYVSKKANSDAKAQTPPNYLVNLSSEERRLLQIPESFLGPLATPIKSESFITYLNDRYEIMKEDFIAYVKKNVGFAL